MAEHSAARKSLIQFDHNWQRLTRDDIYRQRVFGTESGTNEFIPLNDKRKLSLLSMVVYLIFIAVTVSFTWSRVPVRLKFDVNDAIKESLQRTSFETSPTPRFWDDIRNAGDLKRWLLHGFPTFLSPEVQGFNFPIGAVRFTLRRIKQEQNANQRFNRLARTTWVNKNGIELDDQSQERDDTAAFGVYRQFDHWEERVGKKCVGGDILDTLEEVRFGEQEVVRRCKDWCQELVSDAKPCRCWQLSGQFKCEFFYMPKGALQNYSTSDLRAATPSAINLASRIVQADELAPRTGTGCQGCKLFWPVMKEFTYKADKEGWRKTPGFVLQLEVEPQETITAAAAASGAAPLTQAQAVYRRIRDWIEGGLLSRGAVGLAIDFVTFNPNQEVFTWIQLTFQLKASGHIEKQAKLSSLKITKAIRESGDLSMQGDLEPADVVYIILVVVYVLWELWELGQRGTKYFYSGWNLLTVASLVLHIATLVSRFHYLANSEFTRDLTSSAFASQDGLPSKLDQAKWTTSFETEDGAFGLFSFLSALNLLFLSLQLAHYLNDIVPRIGVLVDTMYRSMTPIIFLVVVVFDMFVGFVIWASLMFGKSVHAFKTPMSCIYSCTELLFGQVDPYYELRPFYPISGMIFFFLYMFTFSLVLQNLSKAIVLVSYDDAGRSHEKARKAEVERKRAAESDSSDYLAKKWKQLQLGVRRFFTRADRGGGGGGGGGGAGPDRDRPQRGGAHGGGGGLGFRRPSACLFLAYCVMYVVMTFQQVQIYWANTLTRSLALAIETPTFARTNPISGQASAGNFSTVGTREDVMAFLAEALPKAMFNSSAGVFATQQSFLKSYQSALPARIGQLVVNDWNIVVGRTDPVRISARFVNMTRVGDSRVGALVPASAMRFQQVADDSFSPELAEARGAEILHGPARGFLHRRCNYSAGYAASSPDKANAYVCMLSREYGQAVAVLQEMRSAGLVTNQTATLVVDFVVYNGYAEAFLYVAVTFAFEASGAIRKGITTSTVRLDLYNERFWVVVRVMLEVLVILITCFYLGQSFSNMYKDVQEHPREGKESKDGKRSRVQRCLSVFRGVTLYLVLDPFNLLDLVSSVLTVITMVLWYDIVFMKLRDFYFPEQPVWDNAQTNTDWKNDSQVILDFYLAGKKLLLFSQMCAVNTVLILLRLLKYLQLFPRVRMMFRTLARGAPDVCYFIVLVVVILMGYVLMGNQTFGPETREFSNVLSSVLACFEMFLGTFASSQLRESETITYVLYTYTYVILFRYMLINMFFAIIDKSFIEEDLERINLERERLESARLEEQRGATSRHAPSGDGIMGRSLGFLRQRFSRRAHTAEGMGPGEEDPHAAAEGEPGATRPPTPGDGAPALLDGPSGDLQLAIPDDPLQRDEVNGDLTEGVVKRVHTWKFLPSEMKDWAVHTSSDINYRINEWQRQREDCQKKEQHDLDRILVDAESEIKEETHQKLKHAVAMRKELQKGELKKLKEIHQDQEALAWYIMKREAELKKLEQAKAKKRERFDEIVQAAKSLISSGEDDGARGALEDGR